MKLIRTLTVILLLHATPGIAALLTKSIEVFPTGMNGIKRYRIPGVAVTTKGTILAYCEARKNGSADWGRDRNTPPPLDRWWYYMATITTYCPHWAAYRR